MASTIDATKPIAGNPTTDSVRVNFAAAKSEIEALQVDVAALSAGTVPDATDAVKGIVELATPAEVNTGTDPNRVVTPAGLEAWTGSAQVTQVGTITSGTWNGATIASGYLPSGSTAQAGMIELADTAETNAGLSTSLAVTPAGLAGYTLFAPKASPTFTGTVALPTSWSINGIAVTSTAAELNFVDGVTSNVQTQLNAKAPLASPTFTGAVALPTSWSINGVTVLPTAAELNFVDGVSSNIQTQLDAKAPTAFPTFTGTTTIPTADINGGNIDGTAIGAASHSTGKFTTLQATGALTIGAEIVETVFTVTGTNPSLDPANGTVQSWALGASQTPTSAIATGESITIRISRSGSYTVTWTGIPVVWIEALAPTIPASGYAWVTLWNVGGTLYGSWIGDSA